MRSICFNVSLVGCQSNKQSAHIVADLDGTRKYRGWKFPCVLQISPYCCMVKSGLNTGISNTWKYWNSPIAGGGYTKWRLCKLTSLLVYTGAHGKLIVDYQASHLGWPSTAVASTRCSYGKPNNQLSRKTVFFTEKTLFLRISGHFACHTRM